MILYPPEHFDGNELFILFTGLLVTGIALRLNRRFPPAISAFIIVFNIFLGQTVDFIIGVPPYDWYDVDDHPEYEYFDILLYLVSYPPVVYIMLHIYDKWKPTGIRLAGYVLGWAALTWGLEWLSHQASVFQYNWWKLWYSFPTYIVVYILNLIVLKLGMRLLRASGGSSHPERS